MKPVVFQTIGEAYALGQRFLAAGLYDNFQIANLPNVFLQGMYWEIESVRGFLALNAIIPCRDASVTILTLDGIHPRKQAGEVARLDKGVYRRFLDELKEHQRWLFREFGFLRLTSLIRTDNHPSRVLAGRMGYTLEGVKRCGFQLGRDNYDLCMYSILREEVLHGRHSEFDRRLLRPDRTGSLAGVHGQPLHHADDPVVQPVPAAVRGRESVVQRADRAERAESLREQPAGVLEHEESDHGSGNGRIQSKWNGKLEPVGELRFIGNGRIPGRSWQTGPWLRD